MAVTFKQLLNRALRITGEDEIGAAVTAVSNSNHLLIAEMANQIKEGVEAAHNWRALRQTVSTSVTTTGSATVTEGNESTRVVRIQDPLRECEVALVFDITDSASPQPLKELDMADLLYRRTMETTSTSIPSFFAFDNSAGDVLKIEVHPKPTATRTIQSTLVIPQSRLDAADSTDLATAIKVPVRTIEMGLIRYILEERGEELGINSAWSEEKEQLALMDLVSLDAAEQGGYNLVPV